MTHKKQLFFLVEQIQRHNQIAWDNQPNTFDPELAASMLIEESLELIGHIDPRQAARDIVTNSSLQQSNPVSDVDQFDALLDNLYILIGEFHKLNISAEMITDGLQIVHNANKQKSGEKDANGKVIKPDNFRPPEEQLQKLLDRRT